MFCTLGIGTVRVRKTEKGAKLERLAVYPHERSKGIGSLLLDAVITDMQKNAYGSGQILYLHSVIPAISFYEKLGFSLSGGKFKDAGMDHYYMEKKV